MKFCTECGNKLPDFAKFCNKCGAKQVVVEDVVEEKLEEPIIEEAKAEEPVEETLVEEPRKEPIEEPSIEPVEEEVAEEVPSEEPVEEPVAVEKPEMAPVAEVKEESVEASTPEETPIAEAKEELVAEEEPVIEEKKEESIEEAKKAMRAELEVEKERIRKELLEELKANQEAAKEPTPVVAAPIPNDIKAQYKDLSPAERYQYLLKNDEKFSGMLKAGRGRDLFGLANLLFIVVWLVCSLMPILVLTGANAVTNFSGEVYPIFLNGVNLRFYVSVAESAGYAFCPNSSITGIMSLMAFFAGFLFLALLILLVVLPTKKGYVLDAYEKNGPEGLARALGGIKNFFGVLFSIFVMGPYVANYVGALDLDYGGDKYIYGELFVIPENFITGLIISIILIVIMLIVAIISTIVFKKRINKYLK